MKKNCERCRALEVRGTCQMNNLQRFWAFRSESNAEKTYQTCEWEGGLLSCDCPGWTRRNPPTGRTCRHVRLVQAGLAGPGIARGKQLRSSLPKTEKAAPVVAGRAFDLEDEV